MEIKYSFKFKLLLYVEMDLQEQLCKKRSSIININAVTDQSEWKFYKSNVFLRDV